MKIITKKQKGFSLIDILVSISIFLILTVISTVSFNSWLSNMKVKTVIEGIDIALTQARAEAIKRNEYVYFQINEDTSWDIVVADSGDIVNQKTALEDNENVKAVVFPQSASMVTFDGYGMLAKNIDGSPSLNSVDAIFTVLDKERVLRLNIEGGTNSICNPVLEDTSSSLYCEED